MEEEEEEDAEAELSEPESVSDGFFSDEDSEAEEAQTLSIVLFPFCSSSSSSSVFDGKYVSAFSFIAHSVYSNIFTSNGSPTFTPSTVATEWQQASPVTRSSWCLSAVRSLSSEEK